LPTAAFAAGIAGALALTFGLAFGTSSGAAVNTMTVDLDTTTAGIQASRTVPSGTSFDIAIVAENITTAYNGYQWEIQWDDASLNFVSNVENTAGHGGTLCSTAGTTVDGTPPGKEWVGQGAGCLRSSGTTTFAGDLVTITIQCVADGPTEVKMVTDVADSIFGATFFGAGGVPQATAYTDAQLTCGAGTPPTNTPTNTVAVPTSTNTPVPPTATATRTNTATATRTNTPVPATATNTSVPATATNTPVGPTSTATNTSVPATATNTSVPATATNTSVPATATNTSVPATATNTSVPGSTATNTAVPATATNTSVPATATNTSVPATATNTPVGVPTATNTSVPPTATNTSVPATATNTSVPATGTATSVVTATATPKPQNCLNVKTRLFLIFGILDHFGARAGSPKYVAQFDINKDRKIDWQDLAKVFLTPACRTNNTHH
jgi:hypothetical protein